MSTLKFDQHSKKELEIHWNLEDTPPIAARHIKLLLHSLDVALSTDSEKDFFEACSAGLRSFLECLKSASQKQLIDPKSLHQAIEYSLDVVSDEFFHGHDVTRPSSEQYDN